MQGSCWKSPRCETCWEEQIHANKSWTAGAKLLNIKLALGAHSSVFNVLRVNFTIIRIYKVMLVHNNRMFIKTIVNFFNVGVHVRAHPRQIQYVNLEVYVFQLTVQSNVCSRQSGTSPKKHFPLSLSIPPNTQWPSRYRPRWYFLWKYSDSSMSTIVESPFPSIPPISSQCSSSHFSYSSWQKWHQSTIIPAFATAAICAICVCGMSQAQT